MSTWHHGIALVLVLTASTALAQQKSTFRVQGEAKLDGDKLQIPIFFEHRGAKDEVAFFAHSAVPSHKASAISQGLPVGKITMAAGAGKGMLQTTASALQQRLGLKPGQRVYFAASWTNLRHHWGTDPAMAGFGGSWPQYSAGTSVTIPAAQPAKAKRNSSLRSRSRRSPARFWHRPMRR